MVLVGDGSWAGTGLECINSLVRLARSHRSSISISASTSIAIKQHLLRQYFITVITRTVVQKPTNKYDADFFTSSDLLFLRHIVVVEGTSNDDTVLCVFQYRLSYKVDDQAHIHEMYAIHDVNRVSMLYYLGYVCSSYPFHD
jgi:hypothetical protein